MKNRKVLLGLLLAVLLLASSALAEESVWAYDANNLYLYKRGDVSGDVVIPAEVDGYYVNALRSGLFQNAAEVTSLTMPDNLKALQSYAVSYMDSLTEVHLNEGLEIIDSGNFYGCPALSSITVPASIRLVNGSFNSCDSLKEIRFEGECPIFMSRDWSFNWLPDDCVIYVPDDQMDAYAAALADANGAADRLQPSGKPAVAATSVSEDAFLFDASTGTITGYTDYRAYLEIPSSIGGVPVKTIGKEAFRSNYTIYALILPEGVETVEESAFQQACNLCYASFPSTLRVIGTKGFHNAQLKLIDWSEGLEEIGTEAFQYDQETVIDLPSTLRIIGDSAFEDAWCNELYLGSSVEHIGSRAFANTYLKYMAFDLYEPIDIAADAFEGSPVADLDLPWDSTISNRDAYAALLADQCPDCTVWVNNPISGGVASFPANNRDVITVENGVWTAYHGDQPDLTIWTDYDDCNVTGLGDGLFKGSQTIRSFYPHHCGWFTTIGAEAFADSSVAYVELFPSITAIGDEAFRNCVNITDMQLPESLTSIGAGALRGCTGITELTLPASLTSIGSGLLDGCTGLKKLTVLCDPALLPQDMADILAGVEELYAAPDATQEQVNTLSALAGRAWYNPVPRLGDTSAAFTAMPYASLPGDDFWYDEDYARLDEYCGYELNLYLPREIDGVQLTMIGNLMSRASYGDDFDVELPVVSLVIPETYTDIAMYAFQNCDTLETVICYAPIENLPEGLFSGCTSLREVVFVNGVRNIDRYVFDGCTSLETVYLGEYVESVSEYAFLNMDQTEAFSLEKCITDRTMMPDVDALLSAVAADPMPTPEPTATPAPAVPVGPEGEPYLGTWYGQTMSFDGNTLSLAEYGIVLNLSFNQDGTLLMDNGEEQELSTWSVSSGIVKADTMQGALLADGTLSLEGDGTTIIFTRDAEAELPATTPAPAVPVGPDGEPFLGSWYGQTMEMEGYTFSMSDFGLVMQLTFSEDGTMILFDGEEEKTGPWTVSDGVALIDTMQVVLQEDGTLCIEEDGTKVIFTRDGEASSAVVPAEPEQPAAGDADDFSARLEVRYILDTADVQGFTMSAAMLGGAEYSLVFHENGTADFVLAGAAVPGLPWTQQRVATEDGEADAFVIDYYGTPLNVILTEAGFDLNYFDSMMMHFVAE